MREFESGGKKNRFCRNRRLGHGKGDQKLFNARTSAIAHTLHILSAFSIQSEGNKFEKIAHRASTSKSYDKFDLILFVSVAVAKSKQLARATVEEVG